jgi:hypothetical protein
VAIMRAALPSSTPAGEQELAQRPAATQTRHRGCSKQNLTYRVYMYDGMDRIGGFSQNACTYDAGGGRCLGIDSLAANARCYYDP